MTDSLDRLRAALADRYMVERERGRGGTARCDGPVLAESVFWDLRAHRSERSTAGPRTGLRAILRPDSR